jgi:type II secretory pathway component PulJ
MRVANIPQIKKRGEAGYNLVELMVAVLVIVISVLALYEMFIQGSRMLREESHRNIAIERAVGRMEKMKSYHVACDTVPRGLSGTFSEFLIPEDMGEEPIEAECIVGVTHSTSRQANGLPNYSKVSVEYIWTEPRTGRLQRVQFQSHF